MTALPFNLLSLIAAHLQWPELCRFAQACRLFRTVADDPALYKAECRRVFSCDLDLFG